MEGRPQDIIITTVRNYYNCTLYFLNNFSKFALNDASATGHAVSTYIGRWPAIINQGVMVRSTEANVRSNQAYLYKIKKQKTKNEKTIYIIQNVKFCQGIISNL